MLEEFGQPLVVQELELDEPQDGEVLVRLVACGVCHTDLYTASGADPTGYAPCVLGHEGAGVVERVGPGVALVAPGDHVITLFAPECGECVHCRSARTNRCVAIRDSRGSGISRTGRHGSSREGEPIRHFMGTSTFAEYTVMPEIALAKVTPEAPLDGCAPFACGSRRGSAPRSTRPRRAGLDVRRVRLRARRAGRRHRLPARGRGADRRDRPDEGRLESARHHGATDTRLAADDTVDWIREETGGFGADYTFEATGNVHVMRQAVEAAREAWGLATMIGVAGKGETLDIVPRFLITGRRVTGSSFGGVKGRSQVPQLVDRWLAGEIDVEALLSHRLTLDEVNRGFELMEAGDGIRSVITFA